LSCIHKTFPQVGEFLTAGDKCKALTGKAFAVNLCPTGWRSDGTRTNDIREEVVTTIDDKPKHVNPGTIAANALETSSAGKVGGIRSDPPEVAWEDFKKKDVNKSAIRQPKGECDAESDLPCSCPRRVFVDPPDQLLMRAMARNRKLLEEYIKEHYKTGAFNTCKKQHWPITSGPTMKIHTPADTPRTYRR
jgi:hypothetical protein